MANRVLIIVPKYYWSYNSAGNRFTKIKAKREVRQKIKELQKKFDEVLLLAQKSFKSCDVPLSELRLKVISLCVSQKQNIPLFDQSEVEKISTFSYDEIFSFLTSKEVWDFLNFDVLQEIVKRFIPDDTEVSRKISEYAPQVEAFKNETNLRDYIRVRGSGANAIPEYKDLMVKIERDYNTFTLTDLTKEEGFLAHQFLLNQFVFWLKDVDGGCVQITWRVPASAIPLLKPDKLAKKSKALEERGIREVWVDGRYVYKVNTTVCMHSLYYTTKTDCLLSLQNPTPKQAPRSLFPHSQSEGWCLIFRAICMCMVYNQSFLHFCRL